MQCWRFHDGFFISGFPVLDGVAIWVSLLTSRATFQQLPRGWARVPRQGYPWGGRGGQRGCREALPACRPREPEDDVRTLRPQPRSWSWTLRSRSTPSISLECFGQAVTLGKESVPIGRLGSWLCGTTKLLWRHLRVQDRLLLPAATLDSCIWTRLRTVESLVRLCCLSFFCQMVFDG